MAYKRMDLAELKAKITEKLKAQRKLPTLLLKGGELYCDEPITIAGHPTGNTCGRGPLNIGEACPANHDHVAPAYTWMKNYAAQHNIPIVTHHEYHQGNPNYTPAGTPTWHTATNYFTQASQRICWANIDAHTSCTATLVNGRCPNEKDHAQNRCRDISHLPNQYPVFGDNGLCARATDHRTRQSAPAVANTGPKALIQWAAIADYHGLPKGSGGGRIVECLRRRGYEIKSIVGIGVAAIRRVDAYRKANPS